jgi:hypothetical protein
MSAGMPGSGATLTTLTGGSKCMKCIGGGGVWCSRTYAYVSATSAYQGSFVPITTGITSNNIGMALFPNG